MIELDTEDVKNADTMILAIGARRSKEHEAGQQAASRQCSHWRGFRASYSDAN
jgi:hypothetical protein